MNECNTFEYDIEYVHMNGPYAHRDIIYNLLPPSKLSHSFSIHVLQQLNSKMQKNLAITGHGIMYSIYFIHSRHSYEV